MALPPILLSLSLELLPLVLMLPIAQKLMIPNFIINLFFKKEQRTPISEIFPHYQRESDIKQLDLLLSTRRSILLLPRLSSTIERQSRDLV